MRQQSGARLCWLVGRGCSCEQAERGQGCAFLVVTFKDRQKVLFGEAEVLSASQERDAGAGAVKNPPEIFVGVETHR